ncbi:hypothetical protein HYPSUDRAFT_201364 [Hypholoma sublateritium FD-334 SS-4]|uniref:Uncharacterized protein n=1 Tax=Hypholoma sublateritium (strain FD-334 SS-4) TaxID=945553 RepID=A0A0D2PUR3_HYPSF|nr:hypothetical protein HYPSUDRAFT_201364 [Hypholoma sublateritium FD-334 SS-4]
MSAPARSVTASYPLRDDTLTCPAFYAGDITLWANTLLAMACALYTARCWYRDLGAFSTPTMNPSAAMQHRIAGIEVCLVPFVVCDDRSGTSGTRILSAVPRSPPGLPTGRGSLYADRSYWPPCLQSALSPFRRGASPDHESALTNQLPVRVPVHANSWCQHTHRLATASTMHTLAAPVEYTSYGVNNGAPNWIAED